MSRPAPRLILTRPDPDNGPWLQALTRAGVAALAWPLIEIEAPAHSALALARAWDGLPQCRAVMFVSRAAVVHFFAHRPAQGAWPDATRAWCTGPGTRQALMAQGLVPQQIDAPAQDASWDTEHLWPVVCQQIHPGHLVLFVRGDDAPLAGDAQPSPTQAGTGVGRDWLAQQVAAAQGQIRWAVAYQRACPHWSQDQRQQALQALEDGSVWVFTSAQGLKHLATLLPGADCTRAKAVATHARIAQKARELGFGQVLTCRPAVPDVLASLESMA